MEPKKGYTYTDSFGDDYEVFPKLNFYLADNNIYLGFDFWNPEDGIMESYCDATVNICELPYLYATIDTNNNGHKIVDFLVNSGFGEPTGQYVASGFCRFPVFRFNEEKMKEIDLKTFEAYQRVHGIEHSTIDDQIKAADFEVVTKGSEVRHSMKRNDPEH